MNLKPIESIQPRSRFSNIKYILVGALYGFLIGNAFVVSAAVVDRLLYPDLPLGIDWSLFAVRWGWIAVGLTLSGAGTALLSEKMPGLFVGALVAGFVALVSALSTSSLTIGLKVMALIFIVVPLSAFCLPVSLLLRWLLDKHEQALEQRQRILRIASLILLAVVLGTGGGYFLKMSERPLEALRFMHRMLQTAPQDAENPIHDLPGFQDHVNERYQLFQRTSTSSTEGFDVRAKYDDGYSVSCVVVDYGGSKPYLARCTSIQK